MAKLEASTQKAKESLISLRLSEDTSSASLDADINALQAAIQTLERSVQAYCPTRSSSWLQFIWHCISCVNRVQEPDKGPMACTCVHLVMHVSSLDIHIRQ